MTRSGLSLFLLVMLALPAGGIDADPDPKSLEVPAEVDRKSREAIRAFAGVSFAERERANRELKEFGRMALPALRDALATSSSAEVQLRCEMLLPRAAAEDFRARVDCFLADAKGKFDHKLPGAKEFFAVAGKSEASRALFREIVVSPNQALLVALAGKPEDLANAVAVRRNHFQAHFLGTDGTGRPHPKASDLAALLFAESFVLEIATPRIGAPSTQFLNQPELRTALEAPATKEVYTAILTKWIDTREVAATLYQAMTLSTNLKLTTAMKCAKKLLDLKSAPGSYRGMAMTAIAKNGTAADVAVLEGYLKDSTVLITTFLPGGPGGNKRVPVQTRDAALALCLLVQKKEPADFGMVSRQKSASEIARMQYGYHCFDDADGDADKKRDAAVKKYGEWKADAKKKD